MTMYKNILYTEDNKNNSNSHNNNDNIIHYKNQLLRQGYKKLKGHSCIYFSAVIR